MNGKNAMRAWAAVGMFFCLVGCGQKAVTIDNPTPVAADDYNAVFDAGVEVLRDLRFVVSRQDRRFGVVTTHPMTAGSAVEPWYVDSTTSGQVTESTLNLQRRRTRITLKPTSDGTQAYLLAAEVTIERRQMPRRELNSAAKARLTYKRSVAGPRTLLTEAGREDAFWRPMGRDEHLEQRLVADIMQRAGLTPETIDVVEAADPD